MSWYNYHGRIRKRIEAGELRCCEFVTDYPRIGECLVLYFNTEPMKRPIRPHRYQQYQTEIDRCLVG